MAHAERNKVRAAYNRAERLAERRKMMQAWADYLEQLRSTGHKTGIINREGYPSEDRRSEKQDDLQITSKNRGSESGKTPQLKLF